MTNFYFFLLFKFHHHIPCRAWFLIFFNFQIVFFFLSIINFFTSYFLTPRAIIVFFSLSNNVFFLYHHVPCVVWFLFFLPLRASVKLKQVSKRACWIVLMMVSNPRNKVWPNRDWSSHLRGIHRRILLPPVDRSRCDDQSLLGHYFPLFLMLKKCWVIIFLMLK